MVASPQYLTPKDYLQLEAESPVKHEYFGGEAYAIAGASDVHVSNRFYYPDVMVTCDPRDQETSAYKRFPKLVVEVLSESTEAFDRGDKFADYQTLESLKEYVLINTRHQRVECFRRNEAGLWVLQYYTPETATFGLESIDFTATVAALYEDVTLERAEASSDP